jgi:polyhydroxyalkanoate synthase
VIKSPTYIISAINDHIVPWETAYKSAGLVSGPARFVLGSGGHIAGIVAPPGPKVWHMVGEENVASAKQWREGAERQSGSWWEDWATWSDEHSGAMVDPPRLGSDAHPVLGDGPGEYVRT